jgi:hypothetical protein
VAVAVAVAVAGQGRVINGDGSSTEGTEVTGCVPKGVSDHRIHSVTSISTELPCVSEVLGLDRSSFRCRREAHPLFSIRMLSLRADAHLDERGQDRMLAGLRFGIPSLRRGPIIGPRSPE